MTAGIDPADVETGYYVESPVVSAVSPTVIKPNGDPATINQVGHERWRFSTEGIVYVWHEVRRKRDAELHKMVPTPFHWVNDPCNGGTIVLTGSVAARLCPGSPDVPGFGYLFCEYREPVKREATCDRCSRRLLYPAAESPVLCETEHTGILRPDEWAVLRVESTGKEYRLCSTCIPAGWIYCGWCRSVHKGWTTSESLTRLAMVAGLARREILPGDMVVREYAGSGKDGALIVKQDHFDDRVTKLIELVGRGTVCRHPNPNIARNVPDYLAELRTLEHYRKEYLSD